MKKQKIIDYYNREEKALESDYQDSSFLNYHLIQKPVEQFYARHAALALENVGESMTDIGCGNGRLLMRVLEDHAVKSVNLVDISERMVELASGRLRQAFPNKKVKSFTENILEDEGGNPDMEAELVLCFGVLNHMHEQIDPFLKRLAAHASKALVVSFIHSRFLIASSVGSDFREAGIPFLSIETQKVIDTVVESGFKVSKQGYSFCCPVISPAVVVHFVRESGK